ncbi:hypothetical protein [Actinomadura monticuli]|uniref:Uncharacterized protein n=1 Tax=Actinomadura monticuli TaxID=3097367 RepID=A0ABV4Q373_9ACTN
MSPVNVLYLPGKTGYPRLERLGVHRISTGSLPFRKALQAAVAAALGVTGEDGDRPAPSYGDVQRLVSGR